VADSAPSQPLAPPDPSVAPLDALREIVALLRGPGGCPWDREQTHRSLRPGLIEEAYEVVAAIETSDNANLQEELGDLLLQVVFHAQIAHESGQFTFEDVARGIAEKLVRRHPHVFASDHCADAHAVLQRWDQIKRSEKNADAAPVSLDEGARGLPALARAEKVQKAAARYGFDWAELLPVIAKVREEIDEVECEMAAGSASDAARSAKLEDEIGDLLFATVNLARKLKIDAEVALASATRKFVTRFDAMHALASARGCELGTLTLSEMDALWDQVKASASAESR
jgi:MazG family protein